MAWVYLLAAGLLEVGWPIGMKLGYDAQTRTVKPWPLVAGAVTMASSLSLLFLAQRTLPMGTAYAVWTGIGSAGAFVLGVAAFREPATAARFVCVGLIVAGVVGLKVFTPPVR